jgi:hypothetical protein
MTDSLILKLQEPKVFDAFIQENMKSSTYVAEWKSEMGAPEYCASKAYQAYLAEYKAAVVGSVIDKNGEKPTHQMPTMKELFGTIGRIGDEWQMDNDRLSQYYYLEGRYNDKVAANLYTEAQRVTEYEKLIKFAFDPFEKAVIAPHKRIDMLYFEGLFNGTQTVSRSNNTKANVSYEIDLGVKKFKAKVAAWGNANSTPIQDIVDICDYISSLGKTVMKIRMSKGTFRKMCKADEITKAFTIKLGRADVKPALVSVDDVNSYLESNLLPTIQVEKDRFAMLADGKSVNLTPDNRVVFQCANTVAVLKCSDPLEAIDKLPNKTYSVYDDNLVGFWRNDKGRFVDYEMWAQPVFDGKNNFFILRTDDVEG